MSKINIKFRKLERKDLESYFKWNHPSREFHKYNGPYFKKKSVEELRSRIDGWNIQFSNGEDDLQGNVRLIVNAGNDDLIGEVSWYWKSEETSWLEVGIIIFNENYWGYGIGYEALVLWIDRIFNEKPELVRVGLTTWSGNERMMKLSEKIGLKKEAVYRKARIVNGEYYDSVSYGILREEWMDNFIKHEKVSINV